MTMKELVNVLTVGNIHHVKNTKDSKLKREKDKVQVSSTYTAPCYCPMRCPWKGHGCYGEHGNCNIHFRNVAQRITGTPISLLPSQVFSVGCGQIVRINVTGDMAIPGTSELSSEFVETVIKAYPRTFVIKTSACTAKNACKAIEEKLLSLNTMDRLQPLAF